MVKLAVGVLREYGADERRVALVQSDIGRLQAAGMTFLVEAGAGGRAWYGDETFADVGAEVVTRADVCARSDVLACVGPRSTTSRPSCEPGTSWWACSVCAPPPTALRCWPIAVSPPSALMACHEG